MITISESTTPPESRAEYKRLIANGLVQRQQGAGANDCGSNTVAEVMVVYHDNRTTYYVKEGKPTREQGIVK